MKKHVFILGWVFLSVIAFKPLYAFDQNHTLFDKLLKQYTSAGMVNYKLLQEEPALLNAYRKQLESVTPEEFRDLTVEEQMAFWINAYNAYTLKLILDYYPVRSIKDIRNPGQKTIAPLLNDQYSLKEIEDLLRNEFNEPRVHFALVRASKSDPPLSVHAFTGRHLEAQLDRAGHNFFNSFSRNRFDPTQNTLYLSRIFKWYRKDFKKNRDNLGNFVKPYLSPQARGLIQNNNYKIRFLKYDWRLNDL